MGRVSSGKKMIACEVSVAESEGKRLLGRPKRR
jgi:hypothetical protein